MRQCYLHRNLGAAHAWRLPPRYGATQPHRRHRRVAPVGPISTIAVHGPKPRPHGGNRITGGSSSRGSALSLMDCVPSRALRVADPPAAAIPPMTVAMVILGSAPALAGGRADWRPEAMPSPRAQAQHARLRARDSARTSSWAALPRDAVDDR